MRLIILIYGLVSLSGFVYKPCSAQEMLRIVDYDDPLLEIGQSNWMIHQSSDRMMHFANTQGWLSFDGSSWNKVKLPTPGILRALYTYYPKGYIFTGLYGEFGYWFQGQNKEYEYHSLSQYLEPQLIAKDEIWNILSRDSSILFQSFGKIYEYDFENVHEIIPPYSISLLSKVGDHIYLQVNDHGLVELMEDNSFRLISDDPVLLDYKVRTILPSPQKKSLLIANSAGVFEWSEANGIAPWNSDLNTYFATGELNKGIVLKDEKYVFGTISDGLLITDQSGKIEHKLSKENGLASNNILSLYQDKDENVWVGHDLGVQLIHLNSNLKYFEDYEGKIGCVFSATIYENTLYIGSNQGVFKHNPKTKQFEKIVGIEGQVWQMVVYKDYLLVGHNTGTYQIKNGGVTLISKVTGGRSILPIPDRPDLLIQGTYTGIVVLKYVPNQGWSFSHQIAGFRDVVKKLLFDEDGTLWAVNPYRGLFRLTFDESMVKASVVNSVSDSQGLPSLYNLELIEFNNKIHVYSERKLYKYHQEQQMFLPSSMPLFKPDANQVAIYQINDTAFLEESDHSIRIITPHQDFSTLKSGNMVSANVVFLREGEALIGLQSGYARWDLTRAGKTENKVQVGFKRICVSDNDISDIICYSKTDGLHRLNSQNRYFIRFEFSIPYYSQRPLYRYKLNGFEEEWSEWSYLSNKEYTNLPTGDYTFSVQSSINSSKAHYHFEVLPFWYQTKLAFFFYLLVLTGIIFLVRKLHKYRLMVERRKMYIEKQRELQRQRLALRNVQLESEILQKSQELTNSASSLIRKNDLLHKIKTEISAIHDSVGEHFPGSKYYKLVRLIDNHITSEKDWENFESSFNEIHDDFFKRLKLQFPDLTSGDLKLAGYLKMNLSSKEIALLMNMTLRGIENKRYRLRKKMKLSKDTSLADKILTY